jgi:hypothetical protein
MLLFLIHINCILMGKKKSAYGHLEKFSLCLGWPARSTAASGVDRAKNQVRANFSRCPYVSLICKEIEVAIRSRLQKLIGLKRRA